MSFPKNMSKSIAENISKNLRLDMLAARQKLLDHAKIFSIGRLKTPSKRFIQKSSRGSW